MVGKLNFVRAELVDISIKGSALPRKIQESSFFELNAFFLYKAGLERVKIKNNDSKLKK